MAHVEGGAEVLAEVLRGPFVECTHRGHAVIARPDGEIVAAWGAPARMSLPRSSAKMLQALPLVESGAADAAGLGPEHLALACASHEGAAIHTTRVARWLAEIGLAEPDLRCGGHEPKDRAARDGLIRAGAAPCQLHNNCSGKHAGFLTLAQHIGAGPEYVDPAHPVQRAVRAAFEEMCGEQSPGFGIDGCSAPNFAASLAGIATAMARMTAARADDASVRGRAAARLVAAMIAHPELVAGEGRACTELMRATQGRAAVKTGAEGFFVAILPGERLGVALKVEDGATRAAEAAMAALLVRLGVLSEAHPAARARLAPVQRNWRGLETGVIRAAPALLG